MIDEPEATAFKSRSTPEPPAGGPVQPAGLTRRQFLQTMATASAGAVAFTGCQVGAPISGREFQAQSRVLLAEDILSAYENWYATTCRQCSAGCGAIVRVIEGRAKKLEGNPDHPLNRGKLCARGQAAVQAQYHPDRIQGPMRLTGQRGSGGFIPISWDEALNELVGRLRDARQQGRAGEVAMLSDLERGHRALLQDRFARTYGAQLFTLESLPESPLRDAVRRVFGQDRLPDFDIERAQYVLSFGADFLSTWLSPVHHSVAYGIFRQGNYEAGQFQPRQGRPRGYLVQFDSHFSMTAANADEWVWMRPGTEGRVALSMAQVILAEGLADGAAASALGGPAALDNFQPERVAQESGVPADRIRQLARDFATQRPSVALGGGSAGAHTNGTESLAAVLALNALVGSVGRQGGVIFNPPSPIEGLFSAAPPSALPQWQELGDRLRSGRVQAVLVHDTNPVHGLPGSLAFRDALAQAPFIASFSSFMDETTALADLILPSHLALEDWGDDVPDPGPGYQVITMQQPIVRPLYDTRGFPDVLLTLAEELGSPLREALPWSTFQEMLRESLGTLQETRRGSVQAADVERFWTALLQNGGWWDPARTQAPSDGPPSLQNLATALRPAQYAGTEGDYPFHLVVFPHNTLGSGETAHLPWLQAAPDPVTSAVWGSWVEVNPAVARDRGLGEGDIVTVESPRGRVEVPVYVHPAAPPDVLAMPVGQGHTQFGRWAESRGSNPMDLLEPLADQTTGALAFGATRVRMASTGRRITLPKFEGTVGAYQLPHEEVAKVTREE